MWCVSRTPNQAEPSQSQRDCVPQLKVAVLGYLGNLAPRLAPIPTGLRPTAQGCRTRLPWEPRAAISPIPTGLRPTAQGCRTRLPWEPRAAISPNPNGIVPHSPRLPYSATLGTSYLDLHQSQRDCVPQPKVAVLGYLGNLVPRLAPIPTGLRSTAQGCRTRLPWEPRAAISPNPNGIASHSPRLTYSATLGMATAMLPTPTGLRQRSASNVVEGGDGGAKPQPLRGWDTHRRFPQGSRVRQPWAEGRNLFEVGK